MKKLLSCITLALVLVVGGMAFTACGKKDDYTKVSTAAALEQAIQKGGKIKLTDDISVEDKIFTIDKNVTLDLNNHSLTSEVKGSQPKDLFYVTDGKLTVNATKGGSVTVSGAQDASGYIFYVGSQKSETDAAAKRGEVVINGGNFKVADASVLQVVYGKATINGGKFETTYSDPSLLINRINKTDSSYKNTTKYPTTANFDYEKDVQIVINGGSFKGFNPKDNRGAKEDGVSGVTGYLAAGKTVTENSGWWTVE